MILVLADDFSGAAEMAGIAHRLGFSAEVQTRFDADSRSEVVALDTQTRALPKQKAVDRLRGILNATAVQPYSWIYKKVDSVLRGHVLAETEWIMSHTGANLSVIISANPSKGRVVRQGQYWIHQTPLHETIFAHDPTFPARSSDVLKLLGSASIQTVRSVRSFETKSSQGILVPDACLQTDLSRWAKWLPPSCLAVGGADFFKALLKERHPEKKAPLNAPKPTPTRSRILACGSLAACQSGRLDLWHQLSRPVFLLPGEWLLSAEPNLPTAWKNSVLKTIRQGDFCLIGIGERDFGRGTDTAMPARRLVSAIRALNDIHPIEQILVEGGETAFLLLQSLNHHRFSVRHSSEEGIPELTPIGRTTPRIIPKPGSYPWPDVFLDAH